ncbi:hypothetical protein C8J56DRAFT_935703 [Mycena floridula]|nr:hypothetical protein C8J56DRAFT_935703 [Mycena floridula]
MKRSRDPQQPDDAAPGARGKQSKRSKSIQACNSCRKQKTRCEILDQIIGQLPIQCHRKVLNLQCSYREMDRSIFQSYISPESPQDSPSSNVGPSYSRDPTFPRPESMWSFTGAPASVDWAGPLSAFQELLRQPFETAPAYIPVFSDRCLEDILPRPQIDFLLDIFDTKYIPWVNISLIRDSLNPLLNLVCCTVASRHIEPSLRSLVAPRLQKLTESTVVKMIFDPRSAESLDSIQSLLILSLWSPICGSTESGIRDGRLLIASAISMALNLRINESAGKLISVREAKSSMDEVEMTALSSKARLWAALTNVESSLCVGSGRTPLSRRTSADIYFIPLTPQEPSTLAGCRDLRLRLLSELFFVTEKACSIRWDNSKEGLETWYDEMADQLSSIGRIRRLMAPLELILDYDQFHFHMMWITSLTCRLVVLYSAMYQSIEATESIGKDWLVEVRPRGLNVISTWGKETLYLSEGILIATLETDPVLLATAPDSIFNSIAFAAGMVVGIKFLMVRKLGFELPGFTDKLLSRVLNHLSATGLSLDHVAQRCAHLIGTMTSTWQRRNGPPGRPELSLPTPPFQQSPSTEPVESLPPSDRSDSSRTDASWFQHNDIFQDAEFWNNDIFQNIFGQQAPFGGDPSLYQ